MNPYSPPAQHSDESLNRGCVIDRRFETCVRCGEVTEPGYTEAGSQHFYALQKSQKNIRSGERLPEKSPPTWWEKLQRSYYITHYCRACGCLIIDSSQTVSPRDLRAASVSSEDLHGNGTPGGVGP